MPSRTRLAPSPTGALHLGNARTFLLTWLWARNAGAGVTLRMEDIDSPRVKPGAAREALFDLRWLGIDWDEGPDLGGAFAPYTQTERLARYEEALAKLRARGLIYPCVCTRKEIEASASAPHGPEDDGARYPGTCRGRFATADDARKLSGREPAWRFLAREGPVSFDDLFAGAQSHDVSRSVGDFVVARAQGPAYQLAVVVDDAAMGISHVIRGDDLLSSTPRQLLLYEALGLAPPAFLHVPLVVGKDGLRLAKRHGDTRVSSYRERGVKPERLVGLLASWSGLLPRVQETSAR
ncbi:tRNA glutamyl-Q(34) synthetase GluQRS, partial [bacterium]|nr:tRNA glutamyl-Q(34) synthetase GluQRS [bacterium]